MSPVSQSNGQKSKPTRSGYATVNGIEIYYEVYGEGEPVILIHGGGSTIPSNWGALLPMLIKHHKVIAMELQAHGRTGDRNAPESFEQDAADVISLLKYLKIDKADFIGFSDGGCTTLEIAIHHPQLVRKMVVISANYKRSGMIPGFFEGLGKITFNEMPQALKDAYLDVNPSQHGLLNMFHKDVEKRMSFKDRTIEEMNSIKIPTLVMAGDNDVITIEHTIEMSKVISGARLSILPGTHGSFIGEALTKEPGSKMPQVAADIIGEFLSRKEKKNIKKNKLTTGVPSIWSINFYLKDI
jgi:pimeloyl-ACP methyl ester carboxylesterase